MRTRGQSLYGRANATSDEFVRRRTGDPKSSTHKEEHDSSEGSRKYCTYDTDAITKFGDSCLPYINHLVRLETGAEC